MPLRAYVGMLARGARPGAYTFPPLLKAVVAERGAVASAAGDSVHAHVVKFGLQLNAHVASSLVLMYAARGDGVTARALLDVQPARGGGTPVMWNALIRTTMSSSSTVSNPFAGPDITLVRDLNIHERVPVKLDHTTASYSAWKRYFSLVFREYLLHGHVDGTVDSALMINDEEWMILNATIIRWFYLTIFGDIFHTVVNDEDDAYAPTFAKVVAYLKLEERRMRVAGTSATHTVLVAGTRGGSALPPPRLTPPQPAAPAFPPGFPPAPAAPFPPPQPAANGGVVAAAAGVAASREAAAVLREEHLASSSRPLSRRLRGTPARTHGPASSTPTPCRQFRLSCCSFLDMVRAGVVATPVTYITVLSACGKGNDVLLGMQLHKRVIESGVLPDLKVENALVDMYAECGEMEAAWDLFDSMQVRNIVSWTSVIYGCVRLGQVDRARVLFDRMPERDTVSWTAMIDGYVQAGQFREALEMFREMQLSKVRADEFTMVSIVTACAQLGALETGEWARLYMNRHGIKMDTFVGNALIDMYSKCGSIGRAMDVFNEMHSRDKFTWTAVILGLAVNGHGEEVIDMFDRMLRVFEVPDEVTFIGVLTACTHSGLIDKGRDFFLSMTGTYRIAPNVMHYGCIIDLLGRAGKLREALETIGKMPMKPNSAIWGTLLAACRVHGNSEMGELAAERLLELDPENSMAYVLLSNLYAKSNRWGDVRWLRQLMMEKGIKKEPGCSLVEMNGTIHEFVAGDRSHPMSEEIYSKLDKFGTTSIKRKILVGFALLL
ncbi:putative pentatricopeptide repeat-containing protein At3g15930 [Triticum dicoccoides]|uniref:putative pentatricopeptide repeat-containing protein At3g15930 n=1 Tax=Triticum dicoccoides TaxID=85692 RepID=UPI00188DFC4E|nr:putative pentatricopeptide repeat-containing protein At3g15930 [Triticum dicoccoides]